MHDPLRPSAAQLAAQITASGDRFRLRPLTDAPDEHAAWVDRDLASMFEGFFAERLALPLTEAERERHAERLPPGWGVPPLSPEDSFGERFWIVEHQIIVGTILLATPFPTSALLPVYALYVDPEARGRGAAAAALSIAADAALVAGLRGIELDALWTWGKATRFYLDRGFWLRSWKRGLHLARGAWWPRREVRIEGHSAELAVLLEGGWETMIVAERRGARLGWSRTPRWEAWSRRDVHQATTAEATLALTLASQGWPLATREDTWDFEGFIGDLGGPDGLALRLERFEALARRDGVRVDAPRIPGCPYRDAEALGLTVG